MTRTVAAAAGEASERAARWLRSGLVDADFYGALRGRTFEDGSAAAADFVEVGMPERLSPHPLLDFVSLPSEARRAWRAGEVDQVLEHLTGADGRVRAAGPLTDVPDPDAARAALLALARRLGDAAAGRAATGSAVVEWGTVQQRGLRPDLTSVVLVAAEPRRTLRTVRQLLERRDEHEVEVVVVDNASAPHVALGLLAALRGQVGVRLVQLTELAPEATATNAGIAAASGRFLALVDAHVVVRRGWLAPLRATLDDPDVAGVQPLVLGADDTIESAGLVVAAAGEAPRPVLAGHPREDARRLDGLRLEALSGSALLVRTEDVVALEGLQPAATWGESVVDLCVRLLPRRPSGFRVAAGAAVGSGRKPGSPAPEPLLPHPSLATDPGLDQRIGLASRAAPGLRWSLKLPSAPGPTGDLWGDTHFADALARALRALGQDVVTSRRGAHGTGPVHLDDVSLALRGLYAVPPVPGQVNVLWVISHPDDVDPRELDAYDVVCAASVAWSEELSARTGREVVPLLQATEFEPPAAPAADAGGPPSVVFVGNTSPERERPLVRAAVEAGVDLAVHGRGWTDLPEGVWRGEYVDNDRLPALYRAHGIVLADHWPDMARSGFVANRVFDAVASGAHVISDDVAGIHDVFSPDEVLVATTAPEIAAAVARLRAAGPVTGTPRAGLSFHDRARTLLDLVAPLVAPTA